MPGYTPLYGFEYPVNADAVWKSAGTIERLARAIESKIAGGVTSSVSVNPDTVIRRDVNGRARVADPTEASHISTKAYTDRTAIDTLDAARNYADHNAGEPGPAGPEGATGPAGVEGPAGPAGPAGPKGDQGDRGPIGLTGGPGPKGDTGDRGPTGLTGPKGDQGDTGPAGPKGDQGDAGPAGPLGPEGPEGPEGKGLELAGSVATYADLPPAAPAGSAWLVSSEGRVYTFTGTEWPAEGSGGLIQGPRGATGPAGERGLQGVQGPKGDTGATGPQGLQGLKGDTGERGLQGLKGDKGDVGAEGVPGLHGILTTVTARARRTTVQAIPNGQDTLVTFQSAEWDTVGNMYSSAGLYCRQSGIYLVEAQFPWDANEVGRRNIKVLRNSTSGTGAVLMDAEPAVAWENIVQCSGHVRLTNGDLLRLMVAQDCGWALNGGKGSGVTQASLSATLLRSL